MRRFATLLLFLSLGLVPGRVFAGEPIDQLSATINEFVTIMVNTPVSELRATGLPEKALKLIYSRFDFTEMTKRSLGPHWKTRLSGAGGIRRWLDLIDCSDLWPHRAPEREGCV
jgi:hypothetical protein